MPDLIRFWITFDEPPARWWTGTSVGVTAWDLDDALGLVAAAMERDGALPSVSSVVENVDVSTLDAGHVLPNMHPPSWRGVWFPQTRSLA